MNGQRKLNCLCVRHRRSPCANCWLTQRLWCLCRPLSQHLAQTLAPHWLHRLLLLNRQTLTLFIDSALTPPASSSLIIYSDGRRSMGHRFTPPPFPSPPTRCVGSIDRHLPGRFTAHHSIKMTNRLINHRSVPCGPFSRCVKGDVGHNPTEM